jgi:serine/threonine protein kinase
VSQPTAAYVKQGDSPNGVEQSVGLLTDASASKASPSTVRANLASTQLSTTNQEYYRSVARLGVQAAEALDHAHQLGIVHRDVKPANLIVDDRVHLWVTDFGLAQMQTDVGLTMTGDLLGTLRYMSPEQALAKRIPIDHRTDIYSLGVTFYELLTLEPAYTGTDRQEVLRQVAFEEPKAPRKLQGNPCGAGDDRPEGDGQEPGRALRHHAGPGRRPGPLAEG